MEKLTNRQKDVLDYIKSYVANHGYPPAVREIGAALGLNSPATIQSHITALEAKGYIKKTNSKYRSLEIVGNNEYLNEDVAQVPLLGKITAGSPIEAIETPDEYFSLPTYLIPNNEEVFTLKVSGESMINAGIFDGDFILVEETPTASDNDIIVALLEDSVTVKRFFKEEDHIRLQPENDTMEPIIVPQDSPFSIVGRVIGLYRAFK